MGQLQLKKIKQLQLKSSKKPQRNTFFPKVSAKTEKVKKLFWDTCVLMGPRVLNGFPEEIKKKKTKKMAPRHVREGDTRVRLARVPHTLCAREFL